MRHFVSALANLLFTAVLREWRRFNGTSERLAQTCKYHFARVPNPEQSPININGFGLTTVSISRQIVDLQFFRIFPIGSLNDFRRSVLGSDPSAMVWYNTFSSPISYSQTQVRTSSRHSQLIIALACWSNRICFAKDARELWTGKVRKGRSQTRLWRGCTRKKVAVWHFKLAK